MQQNSLQKILLLNGAKVFGNSQGRLNTALHNTAKAELGALHKEIRECEIDRGYVPEEQAAQILWADAIIWQFPAWWMGEPWTVKKYMDEVFTAGGGRFLTSDGRHRTDPAHGYGTGGLLTDKRYMLSSTWNAPLQAFTEKGEFFGGLGVDGALIQLHKALEFIGMSRLPSFSCHDVVKNPQVEQYLTDYRAHLRAVFA